mmetsp:Transcript_29598/g.68438  ORF Transcript_29598/g.68438 Transcript_29598/m.68438 type:complete len:109 (-) Transcript_29598:14-340(-)
MGSCMSSTEVHAKDQPGAPIGDYKLKKRRAGNCGMFWRLDPTGKVQLVTNVNWPRDGATIRGQPIDAGGEKWLRALRVRQVNGAWVDAPVGAFLPFEYNNHYYLEEAI